MKKRKIVSLCIIIAILSSLLTLVTVPAFAAENEVSMSVDYGENWIDFETLDELLYAVSEGESHYLVKLLSDITVSESIVIPTGSFEIYFNGHTIRPSSSMSESAVLSVLGDACLYLCGIYDAYDADSAGGIDAGALRAISVGGEYDGAYGYPFVSVSGIELKGGTAVYLDKTEEYGGAYVDIGDGAVLTSTLGSAISSADEESASLPSLSIRTCEISSKDGVAQIDVNAMVSISEAPVSEITVKLKDAPYVFESADSYSSVRYIAKSDAELTPDMLPYGYYVEKNDGATRVRFDSTDSMYLSSGDEYVIDRLEEYFFIYTTNYGVDTIDRVMADDGITPYFTEKGDNEVKIRVVPYFENTPDDIIITLKDSFGDDVAFTRAVVDFEGTEVIEVTFAMPEDSVELIAEPVGEVYNITKIPAAEGGDFDVDKTEAAYGETVTVTVSPEAGYVVSKIYEINGEDKIDLFAYADLTFANTERSRIDNPTSYTFDMPDWDIELSVEFVRADYVYFRVPNTEQWSYTARAIYRKSEDASVYYNAKFDVVTVDGEDIYQSLIPEDALDFLVQNYMVGMPESEIVGGPAWSRWYDIEANRVYEYEPAEKPPFGDNDGGESGSTPEPTPPPAGDDLEDEGDTPTPAPDGGEGGNASGGATTPEPTPTPPATGGEGSTQPDTDNTPDGDKAPEGDTKPAPDKDGEIEMASPEVIKIATIVAIALCVFLYSYLLIKDANYKDIFNIFRD